MSNSCKACDGPLGHPSQFTNIYTQYCYTCKICSDCKQIVSPEDLSFNLKYLPGEPFMHCSCMVPALYESLKNRSVEVSEKELDLLNASHLMVRPNIDLSIDTNCKTAEIEGIKWFNDLPTLDEKFLALRRMETLAACFSILLKKEPGSKTIRISLDAASTERFAAASKKDIKHLVCSKCKGKFPELDLSAHFKDCVGAPPRTQAKEAVKRRTAFEKAVDVMMKYGMTAGEAKMAAEAQFIAQGMEMTYSTYTEEFLQKG